MPNASVTEFGNVNVKARAGSRGTRSEDSARSRGQTIARAEYERVAALQDAHRAAHRAASRTVVADGFVGSDPKPRTRARLIMEAAKAKAGAKTKASASASADASAAGIVAGAIEWTGDPGFGCDVAAAVPGLDESLVTSLG